MINAEAQRFMALFAKGRVHSYHSGYGKVAPVYLAAKVEGISKKLRIGGNETGAVQWCCMAPVSLLQRVV